VSYQMTTPDSNPDENTICQQPPDDNPDDNNN
jgi:hypothetical protein